MTASRNAVQPVGEDDADSTIIQSLDKGLRILESIIAVDQPVRVIDIARDFAMNKATAYRYLATLERVGLLRQDSRSREYALGAKILAWVTQARSHFQLTDIARPILEKLAIDSGHEAHLGVLLKDAAIVVDTASPNTPVSVRTVVGTLEPLHCTALGKAILAFLPDHQREALIDAIPLPDLTPKTIVDRKFLRKHIGEVRRNKLAVDAGEHIAILTCIAAPILSHNGYPLGSVGISMVTALAEARATEQKRLSGLVNSAAQSISIAASNSRE